MKDERNIVEVETKNFDQQTVIQPFFSLTLGQNDVVSSVIFACGDSMFFFEQKYMYIDYEYQMEISIRSIPKNHHNYCGNLFQCNFKSLIQSDNS